jgi:hypothetical protein
MLAARRRRKRDKEKDRERRLSGARSTLTTTSLATTGFDDTTSSLMPDSKGTGGAAGSRFLPHPLELTTVSTMSAGDVDAPPSSRRTKVPRRGGAAGPRARAGVPCVVRRGW